MLTDAEIKEHNRKFKRDFNIMIAINVVWWIFWIVIVYS